MKKRFLRGMVLFLLAVLFLSGIGISNVMAQDTVNLKLLIAQPRFRDQYEDYLDAFVKQYQEEKGIKVEYQLEMPSTDKASQILKTRLVTGENLDIFMFHAINEKAQYYDAGYLADLSDEPWVDGLYGSAREAVTYDGKILGLPLESLHWGIIYNKGLFNELGIEPAMTLDELKENAEKIKEAGKTPFLTAYNEYDWPQLFLPLTTGAFVNSSHPDFIEKMYAGEASYFELQDMFNVIDLVHANTNDDALEIGGADGSAEFATGEYGMWVQGPWFSETILRSNPDFKFGVAPLPVSNNENQTMINSSVSTTIGVSSFSENKEVAKDLVAFFLNPEHSSEFFQSVQFNPISEIHQFDAYPWIEEAVSYVEAGKSYLDPSIPQAVKDESGKMLQVYYSDIADQDEVLKALDDSWSRFNKINNQ